MNFQKYAVNMPHPAGRMSFVELVRRKVEKMARGPCLLCFHEAGVALSHLIVSKKRLDMILAFSNSYGDNFRFFFIFCQFLDGFITKKMLKSLPIQKNYFHFHSLQQFHSECLNQFGEKWRKWLEGPVCCVFTKLASRFHTSLFQKSAWI